MLRSLLLALALAVSAARVPAADPASAVTGVAWESGYRSWTAVAPSHRTDKGHLRLMLANPTMAQAYREGTLPFPEGSAIAKLVYVAAPSTEWPDAVVPGQAVSVELMVKDSTRYAATGGWGFGRFTPLGRPVGDAALYETCFPCHLANVIGHDFVFTRWAP